MSATSIAYRIGVDGKADTQRDFADIGASGDAMSARLVNAYQRASDAADMSQKKLRDAALKLGAVQPATPVQAQINDTTGVSSSGASSARDSASALKELLNEQDQAARKAELLRGQIDPLYAAQQRYNVAINDAAGLLGKGAITEAEHAAATKLAADALKTAEKAARDHAAGVGLNNMQLQELTHVGRSAFDAMAAGASPFRVLTMEGGRLYQALGTGEGGVAGALSTVTRFVNPATVGFALVAGALAVGAKLALDYQSAQSKASLALQFMGATSGATVESLHNIADATASGGGVSVKTAEQMELAFAKTGKISSDLFGGLISIQRDYAAATGQESDAATASLAKIFEDPAKGAAELTDQLHFLDGATLKHIENLQASGDRAGAAAILHDKLAQAVHGAADELPPMTKLVHDLARGWDDAAGSIGRYLALAAGGGTKLDQLNREKAKIEAQGGDYHVDPESGAVIAGSGRTLDDVNRDIAAERLRQASEQMKAQQRDQSVAARAAGDALNPKQTQIDAIKARQATLKDAMANSGLLAQTGLSSAQAQADIDAGNKQIAELEKVTQHHDRHAEALAREAKAMLLNTQQSWALAAAYEQNDAEALKAEAVRKAMTAAAKSGAAQDAEVARQLDLSIAQEAVTGAKRLASLKDENAARAAANDNVKAGLISVVDLNSSMSDEAALRPLLTARTAAQTTAIADQGKRVAELTGLINAMRAAQQRAREEQAKSDYLQADHALDLRLGQAKARLATVGDHTGARDVLLAGSQALQEATDKHYSDADTASHFLKSVQAAQLDQDAARADRVAATVENQKDQIDLSQRELDLVGATVATHDEAITRLKTEQQLKRDGISLTSADGQTILANALKLDQINRKLVEQQAIWNELKQAGEQLVDDATQLLNPENWSTWGDAGKKVLDDLIAEMLKLEVANPLKNLLFGEDLPTLTGAASFLFGGMGGPAGGAGGLQPADLIKGLPGFASGTDDAPGGPAMVGEEGPEIVDLPKGASVTPAGATRDLMRAVSAGGQPDVHIHLGDTTVNVQGGGPDAGALVQAALKQHTADVLRQVPALVQDGIRRRIIRIGGV